MCEAAVLISNMKHAVLGRKKCTKSLDIKTGVSNKINFEGDG